MATLEIKQPVFKATIFFMIFLISLNTWSYLNNDRVWLIHLIIAFLALIVIAVEAIKWKAKKETLRIEDDGLTVGDTLIKASEIKTLHIKFSGVVGLKPHGKWIVPTRLRFGLVDTDRTDVLAAWAKKNGVKIRYGNFSTWY